MAKKDDKPSQEQPTVIPIEGSEKIQPQSIQDIAKKNYENAEALAQEGKQPPPMPATPVNLASFQNRDNLPEEKRKALEPRDIEGHPAAQKRAEKGEKEPKKGSGSVTDELLGGGTGPTVAQEGGQPTGPAFDAGGRTVPAVKSRDEK